MVQRAIIWGWNRVVVVEVGVDWTGRILRWSSVDSRVRLNSTAYRAWPEEGQCLLNTETSSDGHMRTTGSQPHALRSKSPFTFL